MALKPKVKEFCSDKDGKIVIGQFPNFPLILWFLTKGMSLVTNNKGLKTSLDIASLIFLTIWALLELTRGVNSFRKTLGAITLVFIAIYVVTRYFI